MDRAKVKKLFKKDEFSIFLAIFGEFRRRHLKANVSIPQYCGDVYVAI